MSTDAQKSRERLVVYVGEELVTAFNEEAERRNVSLAELGKEILHGRYHPDLEYVAKEKMTGRGERARKTISMDPTASEALEAEAQRRGGITLGDLIEKLLEESKAATPAKRGRKTGTPRAA